MEQDVVSCRPAHSVGVWFDATILKPTLHPTLHKTNVFDFLYLHFILLECLLEGLLFVEAYPDKSCSSLL